MKIDRISPLGIVCLISKVDGVPHRRTLAPGDDISTEPPEVQAKCTEAWTDDVKEAYKAHLESAV